MLPIAPKESFVALVVALCAIHAVSHLALTVNRRFEEKGDRAEVS